MPTHKNLLKNMGIKRRIKNNTKLVSWFFYKGNLYYIYDDYKHNSLIIRKVYDIQIHKEHFEKIKSESDLHKKIITLLKKKNFLK